MVLITIWTIDRTPCLCHLKVNKSSATRWFSRQQLMWPSIGPADKLSSHRVARTRLLRTTWLPFLCLKLVHSHASQFHASIANPNIHRLTSKWIRQINSRVATSKFRQNSGNRLKWMKFALKVESNVLNATVDSTRRCRQCGGPKRPVRRTTRRMRSAGRRPLQMSRDPIFHSS